MLQRPEPRETFAMCANLSEHGRAICGFFACSIDLQGKLGRWLALDLLTDALHAYLIMLKMIGPFELGGRLALWGASYNLVIRPVSCIIKFARE